MTPEQMTHVSILCPKAYQERVIESLYRLGAYHIVDHKKTVELDIAKPLQKAEKLAEIIVKLRGVMSHLSIQTAAGNGRAAKKQRELSDKDYYELGKKSKELYLDVVSIINKNNQARDSIKGAQDALALAETLQKLGVEPGMLQQSKTLCSFIGRVPETANVSKLQSVTPYHELLRTKEKQGHALALFAKKEFHAEFQSALQAEGFQEITISPLFFSSNEQNGTKKAVKSMAALAKELRQKIEEAGVQLRSGEQQLRQLREQHKSFLITNESLLREESKKAEAPLRFGETRKAFTVQGWIPARQLETAKKELSAATKNTIYIEERPPEEEDSVPIKLKNTLLVKPYEFLVSLYELPNYKEIDPSVLMFMTFPLFFGFMLGDVGYGLVTLALFCWLRKKLPAMKQLLTIMIFSSIITILFGFAFGEYFGFEHLPEHSGAALCESTGICLPQQTILEHGVTGIVYDFPRLLSRVHSHVSLGGMNILSVLAIGALVGVIHLNLALLIGVYNAWKAHGFFHAFLEKISWILLQASVAVIVLSYAGTLALTPLVGYAMLAASVFLIYKGEGIQGLVELPAIFSNILSYLRLGAVGLASVGLAVVVNENLAIPYIQKGGIFAIIGIFCLIFGHIINIGLGVLGPFLHSLRLHYVEFFSKFYKGGGMEYAPFGRQE
ncbi:V-type ATP synthase subunit I [Candidatus Woesearchaeota archaeon]|nr:V-type ATP synthase subunit I [Candidatus Woesearchaeota archaeon]